MNEADYIVDPLDTERDRRLRARIRRLVAFVQAARAMRPEAKTKHMSNTEYERRGPAKMPPRPPDRERKATGVEQSSR